LRKILLTVAYDGTNYAGWQRQKNALGIQECVENAINELYATAKTVTAASRTDAGVHAMGQRVAFEVDNMQIPIRKLPQVLNRHLPMDITVQFAEYVPLDFNPRFKAISKSYRYQIYNAPLPNPLVRRYSAFIPNTLNVENMRQAAKHFIGYHDFAAFCATGSSAKTTTRTIFDCTVEVDSISGIIKIEVSGDAFLYNMVRIMAGTLVYVGLGKIKAEDIPKIIASLERNKAGKTMPPEGLVLLTVKY